jgi:hypothetical protein
LPALPKIFLKEYAENSTFFVDATHKLSYSLSHQTKPRTNQMTLSLVIAFGLVLAALQGLSLFLTGLETAAKRIEGRSTWIAKDGTAFEEFAVSELKVSGIMQGEFNESGNELVFGGAVPAHANS